MAKLTLTGIAASDGIAVGPAYLLVEPDLSFEKKTITDVEGEIKRFEAAVAVSISELEAIRDKAKTDLGEDKAAIFDAHLLVAQDPEVTGQIAEQIKNNVNAEAALQEATDTFITIFESMDNEYMRERAADIRDVRKRIMAHLLNVELPSPTLIDTEVVVVAEDLTPSDTAQLNRNFVQGFVTDIGGRTSHSAIMARSLEIPAIVGSGSITESVSNGTMIIVDGLEGHVLVDPTAEELAEYQEKQAAFEAQQAEWEKLKNEKSVSKDGKEVLLVANIGSPGDMEGVTSNGAEGVGLYRTEFLFMGRDNFPTEDEQFEAYKAVLEGVKEGGPVVVRTLDIGGDKNLSYLKLPEEMNPFLGVRAIRLCFQEQDMFRTQLRALLRASVYGNLHIMFPMIATLGEFRKAKGMLAEERAKLVAEGIKVSDHIEVGIMIEIPAAAIIADQFAKEVDFMSIGTNDLIQYSMAADRMNQDISYLYQPYNPAILRLVKNVIDAAHKEGKWAGMCGEMAGDQTAVPLLLGLGLDEFSMSASSVLKTRSLIAKLSSTEMAELAEKAINCATQEDVIATMDEYLK
ncbi:phosphoenolpyruvate--protein phosphotransferase [Brochothrix campestris]|uniref:Phosphoenolpyruvate-protein phosphotransferase n=1 Tax=Brochothrix campestris FSL F6-1037 TaxID=1265861 RepID=W7D1A0_9LIST|nr:phosphoenolpyruvate--protein phosphotransferase [Brochothrix campestris]EUJ39088.1 phosphoenolpyruvate-protein phosphotransferase [Brochothrix campestris FSL F6-1037]